MENKKDWEELEKWQENQKTKVVDKYGINIYETNRSKENKKIELVTKLLNKILKVILGIIITSLIIAIFAAFLFILTKFSNVRKSVDADINDITKPFGEKVKIITQDVDEKGNGRYTLTINSNKKIIFNALKDFGNMKDDFMENAMKYHFENWNYDDKTSFIIDEKLDEDGLLDYDIYIKISNYEDIDEAMKKIIDLANYFENQGMYYLAFNLYLKVDLNLQNGRIYPYNSYPYPENFDPIKNAQEQYLSLEEFSNRENNSTKEK